MAGLINSGICGSYQRSHMPGLYDALVVDEDVGERGLLGIVVEPGMECAFSAEEAKNRWAAGECESYLAFDPQKREIVDIKARSIFVNLVDVTEKK